MARPHQLFLLHGMGHHPNDWGEKPAATIKRLYKQYAVLNQHFPFDKFFKIVPIRYDDIFEERRKQWKEAAGDVLKALQDGGLDAGAAEEINDINTELGEDKFLTTHILDVLLYRFAATNIGEYVRTHVGAAIGDVLKGSEAPEWSVIAHSLGTAVAHDALCQIWGGRIVLPTSITRPVVVAMISNVSRVLERSFSGLPDVYDSMVRPGDDRADSGCDYYINVRHKWDVIAMPKCFKPAGDWPTKRARDQERYIEPPDIEEFASENIHDLEHYLENPKMHIPLFRALTDTSAISEQEEKLAIAAHRKKTLNGKYDKYRDKIKKWSLPEDEPEVDWTRVIRHFSEFLRLSK